MRFINNVGEFDSTIEDDKKMSACLRACKPGCDYWVYELTHTEKGVTSADSKEELIVPLNDYVQITQKYAYTWYKVIADFGGLLYDNYYFFHFAPYFREFWIGAG